MATFEIKIINADKVAVRIYGKDTLEETNIPVLKNEILFTRESFRKLIAKANLALAALDQSEATNDKEEEFNELNEEDFE